MSSSSSQDEHYMPHAKLPRIENVKSMNETSSSPDGYYRKGETSVIIENGTNVTGYAENIYQIKNVFSFPSQGGQSGTHGNVHFFQLSNTLKKPSSSEATNQSCHGKQSGDHDSSQSFQVPLFSLGESSSVRETAIKSLYEQDLGEILKTRNRVIVGTVQPPIPVNFNNPILPLGYKYEAEAQSSYFDLDGEKRFSKREDFEILFEKFSDESINLVESFALAREKAEIKANHETNNQVAREAYVNQNGNSIALIGPKGIGTTMLAKEMMKHISDNQANKALGNPQKVEEAYIFYISLNEIDFLSKTTLFRVMMTGCEHWKHSSESDDWWVEKLEQNPNVWIIFNDLHHAETDKLFQNKTSYPSSDFCTPDVYIRKILEGRRFPLAKKLITSHPGKFFQLNNNCKPRFVISVLGLSKESRVELGMQVCRSCNLSEDKLEKLKELLHRHPYILSPCRAPAKCIIIHLALSSSNLLLTNVLVESLRRVMYCYGGHGNVKEFWKLASLAWNYFVKGRFIFMKEEFDGINPKMFQAFLLTVTKGNIKDEIANSKVLCKFSDPIWHELFAATYMVFVLPVEEFERYIVELTNPLWKVMSTFVFGLIHPDVTEKIKIGFSLKVMVDYEVKNRKLRDLISRLKDQDNCNNDNNNPQSSLLSSWIEEAGNITVTPQNEESASKSGKA